MIQNDQFVQEQRR